MATFHSISKIWFVLFILAIVFVSPVIGTDWHTMEGIWIMMDNLGNTQEVYLAIRPLSENRAFVVYLDFFNNHEVDFADFGTWDSNESYLRIETEKETVYLFYPEDVYGGFETEQGDRGHQLNISPGTPPDAHLSEFEYTFRRIEYYYSMLTEETKEQEPTFEEMRQLYENIQRWNEEGEKQGK
jgi:hypothetical protein